MKIRDLRFMVRSSLENSTHALMRNFVGLTLREMKRVGPRRPFCKEKDVIDYEFDSDEEWEDEEDGESLGSDAGSRDSEACSEDEDDDVRLYPALACFPADSLYNIIGLACSPWLFVRRRIG